MWGYRSSFADWKTYDDLTCYQGDKARDRVDETSTAADFHQPGELVSYRNLLVSKLHVPQDEASSCILAMMVGDDQALKLLVIALCPRLKTLRLMQYRSNDSA